MIIVIMPHGLRQKTVTNMLGRVEGEGPPFCFCSLTVPGIEKDPKLCDGCRHPSPVTLDLGSRIVRSRKSLIP